MSWPHSELQLRPSGTSRMRPQAIFQHTPRTFRGPRSRGLHGGRQWQPPHASRRPIVAHPHQSSRKQF
eukprot:6653577-Pyramimonas_sp.AAC.1